MVAAQITEERLIADSSVLVASSVERKCLETDAHIPDSAGDVKERIVAHCRVRIPAASG